MDLIGKRKKRLPPKPINEKFVKWLTEWRDEEREKQSKLQYVYNKVALQSMSNISFSFRLSRVSKTILYLLQTVMIVSC